MGRTAGPKVRHAVVPRPVTTELSFNHRDNPGLPVYPRESQRKAGRPVSERKMQKDGPVTAGFEDTSQGGKAHCPLPCPGRNKLSRHEFGTLV